MKVNLIKQGGYTTCFIAITHSEAMALIQSLANQLVSHNPNVGRLESRCKGDAYRCTVAVMEE